FVVLVGRAGRRLAVVVAIIGRQRGVAGPAAVVGGTSKTVSDDERRIELAVIGDGFPGVGAAVALVLGENPIQGLARRRGTVSSVLHQLPEQSSRVFRWVRHDAGGGAGGGVEVEHV